MKSRSGFSAVHVFIVVFALLTIGAGLFFAYRWFLRSNCIGCSSNPSFPAGGFPCTEEAKLCPDGSAVGRTGPNCSFAECPAATADDQSYQGVIAEFLAQWPEIQKGIPFSPTLGATSWHITAFEFLDDRTFLVAFEDGHIAAAAVYHADTPSGGTNNPFPFALFYFSREEMISPNDFPLTVEAWYALIARYGGSSDVARTYVTSIVRGTEVITFNGWVNVPENPFVKNQAKEILDTSSWKTYRNEKYGFTFKYPPSLREELDGKMIRFSDGTTYQGYFLRILERGNSSEFSFVEKSINVENIVGSASGFTAYSVKYETPPYALVIPISNDIFVILAACDCLLDSREQIFSTFQKINEEGRHPGTIDAFLREWPEVQKSLAVKPVLGATSWHVTAFQFFGNDGENAPDGSFLVAFEDGHVAGAAVVRAVPVSGVNLRSFELLETVHPNNFPFTVDAWYALLAKHGGSPNMVKTFVTSVVRGGSVIPFNGWVEVPENSFVKTTTPVKP